MFALACGLLLSHCPTRVDTSAGGDRAGFVAQLGRDTVGLESTVRNSTPTGARQEGDIVVRVPGTVRLHYTVDVAGNGEFVRSDLTIDPSGTREVAAHRVRLEAVGDSVRMTVDSATIGGAPFAITYGSPRRRGRESLGHVVPYGRVWRTGANEATTLVVDSVPITP